jgi:rhodanese-related sulfurtransferase
MPETLELTPQEVLRLVKGEEAALIDVREPEEYAIARIDGARLIPMQTIPAELPKLKELAGESKLVILCHHGVRSLQVASWLRAQGLENCYSVAGGIDRWSQEIDPTVPRY